MSKSGGWMAHPHRPSDGGIPPEPRVRRVKVPFQIGDRVEAVVENIRGPLVNGIKNGKVVDINRWGRIRVQALPNGPHYWYTPDEIQCIAEKQHDSMLTQLMKVWKDADIDGSGYLNRLEAKAVMIGVGLRMTDDELDTAFDDMDQDGSGVTELHEVVTWWRENQILIQSISDRPKPQSLIDKNNSMLQLEYILWVPIVPPWNSDGDRSGFATTLKQLAGQTNTVPLTQQQMVDDFTRLNDSASFVATSVQRQEKKSESQKQQKGVLRQTDRALAGAMRRRRQRQRQQSLAHQSPHHTPSLVSSAFRRNLEASVHLDDDDVEGREQLEHRIRGFGEQISRMMTIDYDDDGNVADTDESRRLARQSSTHSSRGGGGPWASQSQSTIGDASFSSSFGHSMSMSMSMCNLPTPRRSSRQAPSVTEDSTPAATRPGLSKDLQRHLLAVGANNLGVLCMYRNRVKKAAAHFATALGHLRQPCGGYGSATLSHSAGPRMAESCDSLRPTGPGTVHLNAACAAFLLRDFNGAQAHSQVAMSFCDSAQERRTDTSKGGKAKLPLLASQVREMVGLRALGVYVRGLSLLSQSASHHSSMIALEQLQLSAQLAAEAWGAAPANKLTAVISQRAKKLSRRLLKHRTLSKLIGLNAVAKTVKDAKRQRRKTQRLQASLPSVEPPLTADELAKQRADRIAAQRRKILCERARQRTLESQKKDMHALGVVVHKYFGGEDSYFGRKHLVDASLP